MNYAHYIRELGRGREGTRDLSLDEAFLDVSGTRRLHGPPDELAATIGVGSAELDTATVPATVWEVVTSDQRLGATADRHQPAGPPAARNPVTLEEFEKETAAALERPFS